MVIMNDSEVVDGNVTTAINATAVADTGAYTALMQFSVWYQRIHGYLSLVACMFGSTSNAMNIAVLTRRALISPTNRLLTALAVADLVTMVFYIPYASYFYCYARPDEYGRHPTGWIRYLLFNNGLNITTHTIAMWLTVSLAVFRYVAVCHPTVGLRVCTLRRARIAVVAVVVSTVIFCLPNYIMFRVIPLPIGGYWFDKNQFITDEIMNLNFWIFGVVLKVVPCVLLTVLSALLILAMRRADRRRRLLKMKGRRLESEKAGEYNRTTSMLVAVVLCFVVTELPQGVLAFLSGIDNSIFHGVYAPLGDIWDIVVLINSSVNFLLYCTMSRQFRGTFWELFIAPVCWRLVAADDINADRGPSDGRAPPGQSTFCPASVARHTVGRGATNV